MSTTGLIHHFKEDHRKLLELLEASKKGQGVIGSDWKDKLFEAKELFLKHLAEEDEKLYPAMQEAAKDNELLYKIVGRYVEGMKRVSEVALKFFEKHKSVSGGSEFTRDFAELEVLLKDRIAQEEAELYKEYEKNAKE